MDTSDSQLAFALATVIQTIVQRPNQTVLLGDLGALLPDDARFVIQRNAGLKRTLKRYPIFKIEERKFQETVTLDIELQPLISGHIDDGHSQSQASLICSALLDFVCHPSGPWLFQLAKAVLIYTIYLLVAFMYCLLNPTHSCHPTWIILTLVRVFRSALAGSV